METIDEVLDTYDELDEAQLGNSLVKQYDKFSKQVNGAHKGLNDAQKRCDAKIKEMQNKYKGKDVLSLSAADLQELSQNHAYLCIAALISGYSAVCSKFNKFETEKVAGITYEDWLRKIDQNTGIFGRDKGNLKISSEDGNSLTGLNAKNSGASLKQARKNESVEHLREETISSEDYKEFQKATTKYLEIVKEFDALESVRKGDPDVKAAMQSPVAKGFQTAFKYMAMIGSVAAILLPGLGAIGGIASSVAKIAGGVGKIGNGIMDPRKSTAQKVMDIVGGAAMAAAGGFALGNSLGNASTGNTSSTETTTPEPAPVPEPTPEPVPSTEPQQIENSIAAQAKAKPGDWVIRNDGTKAVLTQNDITAAQNQVGYNEVNGTAGWNNGQFPGGQAPDLNNINSTNYVEPKIDSVADTATAQASAPEAQNAGSTLTFNTNNNGSVGNFTTPANPLESNVQTMNAGGTDYLANADGTPVNPLAPQFDTSNQFKVNLPHGVFDANLGQNVQSADGNNLGFNANPNILANIKNSGSTNDANNLTTANQNLQNQAREIADRRVKESFANKAAFQKFDPLNKIIPIVENNREGFKQLADELNLSENTLFKEVSKVIYGAGPSFLKENQNFNNLIRIIQ